MKFIVLSIAILFPSVSAFADIELTILSAPAGATVMQPGLVYGQTPFVLKMKTSKKQPCFVPQKITVRWLSGAQAESVANYRVCQWAGKKQTLYFLRPDAVPGGDTDAQYGIELQRLSYEQQQARRQELINSIPVPRQPLHCTSTQVGNNVYTNCY